MVKNSEDWGMLVKKASIINQVVVPRSVRGIVMKHAQGDQEEVLLAKLRPGRGCDDPQVFCLHREASSGPA